MCIGIFGRELDVYAPRAFGVEMRPENVVDRDLFLLLPLACGRGPADQQPECFEWRRTCVQRIVRTGAELLPHEAAAKPRVIKVSFARVDPLGAYDLALCLLLFGSRHSLLHAHGLEVVSLEGAIGLDLPGAQHRAGHVVVRALGPVLPVQAAQLVLRNDLAIPVFG